MRSTPISPAETGQSLHDRLSELSASLLSEYLPDLLQGTLTPTPQPSEGVTYARMLTRDDGKLSWGDTAYNLERRIRGFYPWPGAFTSHDDKTLKLFPPVKTLPSHGNQPPGTIVAISNDGVRIATGDGDLVAKELQLQGRRRMTANELANGRALAVGDILS